VSAPNPILAANPENNAIVKASAGVGKTYLLVTRLIRLLLMDVRPDSILAITFTRKAAAEMQSRLFDRLYRLATLPEKDLPDELSAIGMEINERSLHKARQLYESLLRSEHQVKISTFHAFCQEVLRKFPLEANIPPGFELLDDEATYRLAAWEALYDEVTLAPQSEVAQAMENLYDLTGSLHSTHQALDSFLNQRSDWWAYIQGEQDPALFAAERLLEKLNVDPFNNPYVEFFHEETYQNLKRLVDLLILHNTKANQKQCDIMHQLLATDIFNRPEKTETEYQSAFNQLYSIFFDSKGKAREQKDNATRKKKMGDAGEEEFLQLFRQLSSGYQRLQETLNRHHNYALSSACYCAGQRLCELYQKIKLEQRLLDFTDLEWKTYELLNHSENALWVQYKLDQRIDHFLVDEFQDTNPTQWRLIFPLLSEFAQDTDKLRSVFIVGDEKQSIYSFRRADPLLLTRASDWLTENLDAKIFPMDKSRRSAPPIMNLVNRFFLEDKLLPGFHEHSTFLTDMAGNVTLLPLIERKKQAQDTIYFRNPLETPLATLDNPHYHEGKLIAQTIQNILLNTAIQENGVYRHAHYGDIMILIRSRTHVGDYETALREAGIAYQSNNKGTLFQCQEIQDLIALLDVLFTPYNNLALATVLRSPIFQCSNDSLLRLSRTGNNSNWFEHLTQLAEQPDCPEDLHRAATHLQDWHQFAGTLPIHDMLNHIYHECSLLECYSQTVAEHFKTRVHANLIRFLSLALEIDSGRYPSLGRFIARLHSLIQQDESPDEAQAGQTANAVKILTIHASKGLEAPVVFLSDAADNKSKKGRSYSTLVLWPESENSPTDFLLCPAKKNQDQLIKSLLEVSDKKQSIEDANLLYVALTRARQALYVSGSTINSNGDLGWYGMLQKNWPEETATDSSVDLMEHTLSPNQTVQQAPPVDTPLFSSDKLIEEDLQATNLEDEDSLQRGTIIHRALELLSSESKISETSISIQLSNEFLLNPHASLITECLQEAVTTYQNSGFRKFFDPALYDQAYNEVKIQYQHEDGMRQGIIDRLVINGSSIIILDYKTHLELELEQLKSVALSYQNQMRVYETAIKKLWPDKDIHSSIIFTHFLVEIPLQLN